MKYIGNCDEWIEDDFVKLLLTPNFGQKTPSISEHFEDPQYQYWINQGFPSDRISFTFIFQDHFDHNITLPKQFGDTKEWWFSRLDPGDIVPWHADKFKYDESNIERYWIAMQDYIPGHIFLYENKPFVDYKKGDIFLFNNPTAYHGAGNLSFIPKLSLQVAIQR